MQERQIYIGKRITFAIKDVDWGAHFWVHPDFDDNSKSWGGVEIHRKPYDPRDADNETCWLLGGPCRHDGSSLLASEKFIPEFHWISSQGSSDWGSIFDMLESFAMSNV